MVDYKRIIKSRETRIKILRLFSFVPDDIMLKFQYRVKTSHRLNLKKPLRYTEKLQWYKINYRTRLMTQVVDKWDVRDYVRSIGLEDILTESYGVFDDPKQIHFQSLPNAFVIKDTLGAGGNDVIIVNDKEQFDISLIISECNRWINKNPLAKNGGREWVYNAGNKHRIYIEELLHSDPSEGGLMDYKFLCFNGEPIVMYILADRNMGDSAGCGIFDLDFNLLPYQELDEKPLMRKVKKPENYDLMLEYAKKLSKPFPEARIDLYNVNGRIYFGEITFFDSSGYMLFDPDEFDFILGEKWKLPERLIEVKL